MKGNYCSAFNQSPTKNLPSIMAQWAAPEGAPRD